MDDGRGATLRQLRVEAKVGLRQMARLTYISKSYLGLIETGERAVTDTVVRAYVRVLGGDEVNRRMLLAGLLVGAASPAAMMDGILAGYEKVLSEPRPDVDEWAQRVESHGADYMTLGAATMQARLTSDLIILQAKLDSPELWSAAAKLLTVYGETLPSADTHQAVRWYRAAASAADRSGDLATRTWVRGRAALALAYFDGAGLTTAATLARQSLALSDKPSVGSLNASLALAHVAVYQGDRSGALHLMEAGERAFEVVGGDERISDYCMPEWRFRTGTSMLLSRLGDPRAQIEQDRADAIRPATLPRFAAHLELHRALMLVKVGDRAGGLTYARNALAQLPADRLSLSLRLMMEEIERG